MLAYGLGQIAATIVVIAWQRGNLNALIATPYDGKIVALSVLVLNPVTVAVLFIAARLAKAEPVNYFALAAPRARDALTAVFYLILLIAASDGVLYLSGQAISFAISNAIL